MTNQFTPRETSTVLAALRVFQGISSGRASFNSEQDLLEMDHFEDVEPLSLNEIDALCERINIDWSAEGGRAKGIEQMIQTWKEISGGIFAP